MKKIILSTLAAVMALVPALAGTFSKSYPLKGFTGIQASHVFHVYLSPSSECSVKIEAPDYLEPYIKVEVSRNQLILSVENLPKAVERQLSREKSGAIRADVRMPSLESIMLSGAANLEADGDFPMIRVPFKLNISGAAKASGLSIKAASMDIRMSGAANAGLKGGFDRVDLEASGASKARLGVDAASVSAELSGSAHLDIEGTFDRMSVEASGASQADLKSDSTLSSLDIQCSGASSVNSRNAKARDVSVELSGASNCKVTALRAIEIEATGASTCSYEAGPDVKIDVIQVSRGATLRKL